MGTEAGAGLHRSGVGAHTAVCRRAAGSAATLRRRYTRCRRRVRRLSRRRCQLRRSRQCPRPLSSLRTFPRPRPLRRPPHHPRPPRDEASSLSSTGGVTGEGLGVEAVAREGGRGPAAPPKRRRSGSRRGRTSQCLRLRFTARATGRCSAASAARTRLRPPPNPTLQRREGAIPFRAAARCLVSPRLYSTLCARVRSTLRPARPPSPTWVGRQGVGRLDHPSRVRGGRPFYRKRKRPCGIRRAPHGLASSSPCAAAASRRASAPSSPAAALAPCPSISTR